MDEDGVDDDGRDDGHDGEANGARWPRGRARHGGDRVGLLSKTKERERERRRGRGGVRGVGGGRWGGGRGVEGRGRPYPLRVVAVEAVRRGSPLLRPRSGEQGGKATRGGAGPDQLEWAEARARHCALGPVHSGLCSFFFNFFLFFTERGLVIF